MQDIGLSNCVWKLNSQEIFEKYKCLPGAEFKRVAYTCIPVQWIIHSLVKTTVPSLVIIKQIVYQTLSTQCWDEDQ